MNLKFPSFHRVTCLHKGCFASLCVIYWGKGANWTHCCCAKFSSAHCHTLCKWNDIKKYSLCAMEESKVFWSHTSQSDKDTIYGNCPLWPQSVIHNTPILFGQMMIQAFKPFIPCHADFLTNIPKEEQRGATTDRVIILKRLFLKPKYLQSHVVSCRTC